MKRVMKMNIMRITTASQIPKFVISLKKNILLMHLIRLCRYNLGPRKNSKINKKTYQIALFFSQIRQFVIKFVSGQKILTFLPFYSLKLLLRIFRLRENGWKIIKRPKYHINSFSITKFWGYRIDNNSIATVKLIN